MIDTLAPASTVQPVEYAVAVERFLSAGMLSDGSRRIYRIALTTWAWPLVDRMPPVGDRRRRAAPPVVPLAVLDDPQSGARLRRAFSERAGAVGARTANRELSILSSAIGWWVAQGWLTTNAAAAVRPRALPARDSADPRLGDGDVRALFALRAPLREQVFWHLVYETGAPIERILALDIGDLDLEGRGSRVRAGHSGATPLRWRGGTGRMLPLLLLSRTAGPVFVTSRRAPAGTPSADVCPLTGRGRLSYRRAAELFTAATRPLGAADRGWTLRQLQSAGGAFQARRGARTDRRQGWSTAARS